jgi:hypothetical protein
MAARGVAHGYFASLSPQGGGNRHNEKRSYGDNPLVYFRSKTVQTMGGSSMMNEFHVKQCKRWFDLRSEVKLSPTLNSRES